MRASAEARIVSTSVSAISCSASVGKPSRLALMAICSGDSSPVTYSAGCRSANRHSVWSSNVLFPAPGCPPIKMLEPGTKPPPRTRSNSSKPEPSLGKSTTATSSSLWTEATVPAYPARVGDLPAALLAGALKRISDSVFQAWHSPHWPCHFGKSAPQSLQTNAVFAFATRGSPESDGMCCIAGSKSVSYQTHRRAQHLHVLRFAHS